MVVPSFSKDICSSPDDCAPPWKESRIHSEDPSSLSSPISFLFSSVTLLSVFLTTIGILSGGKVYEKICDGGLFGSSSLTENGGFHANNNNHGLSRARTSKRIAESSFLVTLGATAVLAFLILCEVSNWFNPHSRQLGFSLTVKILLILLVFLNPILQIHQVLDSLRIVRSLKHGRRTKKYFYFIEWGLLSSWLWCFWEVGGWIPQTNGGVGEYWWKFTARTFSEECLSRLGLIGVTLMAVLSGFGAASAPLQSFGKSQRPITEADIGRAQAGLDATTELLETKLARRRSLEAKMKDKKSSESRGIITRVLYVIRSDADAQEFALLQTEINGLKTMHTSLSSSLSSLKTRYASSAGNKYMKPVYITSILFSLYCIYRILTTAVARFPWESSLLLSRFSKTKQSLLVSPIAEAASPIYSPASPQAPPVFNSSKSDPINNVLAILARYWDPQLDREGWSRFIGFILSGVIIFGSIRSVVTTVEVLTRKIFAPFVSPPLSTLGENDQHHEVTHPHRNQILALGISQITGTYVLASALLLRSNLPPEMSSVLSDALGAPALDPRFVELWFDGIFLWSVLVTAIGLYISRRWKIAGLGGACGIEEDEWDDNMALDEYVQVGKII